MTSEAGSRPLGARLAPSGSPRDRSTMQRERATNPESAPRGNGRRAHGAKPGHGATKASNGHAPTSHAPNGHGPDSHAPTGHAPTKASNGHAPTGHAPNGRTAHAKLTGKSPASNATPRAPQPVNETHPAPTPTHLIDPNPLTALLDEAQAAVSEGANSLRDVRERYRAAYLEQVERWETLRAQDPDKGGTQAANDEAMAGRTVGQERSTLGRIDLAVKSLENAWLFLAREDTSLVSDPSGPPSAADAQMRIVEAQEAERSRLAREVHDGPAQALSNAIFQVEVVQRLLDRDERLARAELKQLREVLTRELRGVRAYLSQLRPPLLADLGFSGAVHEAADQIATALNVTVHVELDEGVDALPETVEIVTLRVVQEALQNARKHAKPHSIRVRMTRDAGAWTLEVRDDGRGFEADDPPVGGRRHFGLQFMRERAELIGARFEVRSSPNLGTAVRMIIPPGAMGMPIPGEET